MLIRHPFDTDRTLIFNAHRFATGQTVHTVANLVAGYQLAATLEELELFEDYERKLRRVVNACVIGFLSDCFGASPKLGDPDAN